jgi:hypothetical protein
MEKPLVNKKFLLEKYPGKGGWTYAVIPGIPKSKRARFGWVKIKGFIDDFEIKNYRLMPMATGELFFPIKTEIRKKIKKEAGDWIRLELYVDNAPQEIPEELLVCLQDDPALYKTFLSFSDAVQKNYIDWIFSAKTDSTKVKRIAATLDRVSKGQKLYE